MPHTAATNLNANVYSPATRGWVVRCSFKGGQVRYLTNTSFPRFTADVSDQEALFDNRAIANAAITYARPLTLFSDCTFEIAPYFS